MSTQLGQRVFTAKEKRQLSFKALFLRGEGFNNAQICSILNVSSTTIHGLIGSQPPEQRSDSYYADL